MKKITISDITVNSRMRELDPYRVNELAESIKLIGLLNPITVNNDFVLISGLHRLHAYQQLGIDKIQCNIIDFDQEYSQIAEIDENIIRNELNDIELGEHLLKRDEILDKLGVRAKQGDNRFSNRGETVAPLQTTKNIAEKIGVSERSTQIKKQIAKNLSKKVRDKLKKSPFANNTTGLLQLSRLEPQLQLKITNRLLKGLDTDIKTAIKEFQKEKKKQDVLKKIQSYKDPDYDGLQLLYGDFREVGEVIEDDSIGMIFTDPPYHKDFLHLYEDLSEFASRVLKDGGSCLAYCGQSELPNVLEVMKKHLKYWWTISVQLVGSKQRHGRGIFVSWKPIVWFVKGDTVNNDLFVTDNIKSQVPEYNKVLHPWEQSVVEAEYYIQYITPVETVILDPMMGTGTTGVSALKLGRDFIGIEKERKTFDIAKNRISKDLQKISQYMIDRVN